MGGFNENSDAMKNFIDLTPNPPLVKLSGVKDYCESMAKREANIKAMEQGRMGNVGRVRLVIYPGEVVSATDNDVHFINASQLAHLHNVPLNRCVVAGSPGFRALPDDVDLVPKYHGHYTDYSDEV